MMMISYKVVWNHLTNVLKTTMIAKYYVRFMVLNSELQSVKMANKIVKMNRNNFLFS